MLRVETWFLEQYFRYNIANYFNNLLGSIEEQPDYRRIRKGVEDSLAHAFKTQSAFKVVQLKNKI